MRRRDGPNIIHARGWPLHPPARSPLLLFLSGATHPSRDTRSCRQPRGTSGRNDGRPRLPSSAAPGLPAAPSTSRPPRGQGGAGGGACARHRQQGGEAWREARGRRPLLRIDRPRQTPHKIRFQTSFDPAVGGMGGGRESEEGGQSGTSQRLGLFCTKRANNFSGVCLVRPYVYHVLHGWVWAQLSSAVQKRVSALEWILRIHAAER